MDPMRPVPLAVITHAHADHARPGHLRIIASPSSLPLLRHRLGADAPLEALPFGETLALGRTEISLHPAGHVLGSAQVRIASEDVVWVVSGDYKRAPDPTAEPFELVPCDTFVTESTFALPVYRWPRSEEIAEQIANFWDEASAEGRPALVFAYSLGKAQRVLAGLPGRTRGRTIVAHGAVQAMNALYRQQGIALPETHLVTAVEDEKALREALVIAPPSAANSTWTKRFKDGRTGFASGWMRVRGRRRQRGTDRGFVLSDHADWDDLVRTAQETGARRVIAMHGRALTLARHLRDLGIEGETFDGPVREEGDDG